MTGVCRFFFGSGIDLAKLQALYKFLGLDPNNLIEPQLSADR